MPTFRVIGRTPKAYRRRIREYRAIDAETARQLAEVEGTLIDSVELLPGPRASAALVELAVRLGVFLPDNPSHIEAAILTLMELGDQRRKAEVEYRGLSRTVEPYSLVRSKEGFRLRCWVEEPEDLPDVIGDDEAGGWRHWLFDDVVTIRDSGIAFEYRPETDRPVGGFFKLVISVDPEVLRELRQS